jgi:hypothetical protein
VYGQEEVAHVVFRMNKSDLKAYLKRYYQAFHHYNKAAEYSYLASIAEIEKLGKPIMVEDLSFGFSNRPIVIHFANGTHRYRLI